MQQDLDALAEKLAMEHAAHPFPTAFRQWPERFVNSALGILYPHFANEYLQTASGVRRALEDVNKCVEESVQALGVPTLVPSAVSRSFVESLGDVYDALQLDATSILESDPAAESLDQVVFSYPGFYAVAVHRLAHQLTMLGVPLLPRLAAEFAHSRSGIDIHPGAQIGCPFVIDHGTGVVIGQTAVIGDRVKMFHGVTLGAHQVHKRLAGVKRHPTVEDDVVIYAHATLLGDIVVGHGSVIGGNTWITASVPANTVVASRNPVRRASEPTEHALTEFSI